MRTRSPHTETISRNEPETNSTRLGEEMFSERITLADGRYLIFYWFRPITSEHTSGKEVTPVYSGDSANVE